MKFRDKIKWRINFFKKSIKNKKISSEFIIDILPSHLINKQRRRAVDKILKSSNLFNITDIDDNLNLFSAGKLKFVYFKNLDYADPINQFLEIIYPNLDKNLYPSIKNLVNSKWFSQEGPYEEDGVQIAKGDVVIDAGANIGLFSILAGGKTGKEGKVFAFEPIKINRSLLEENIKLNGLKNVEISHFALGDSNKELKFSMESQYPAGASGVSTHDGGEEEIVSQITLDEFVKQNNVKRVDFIKADIEGMEKNLLKGAEQTIKKFRPKMAICTYHLPDDPEILERIIKDFVPQYKMIKTFTKLYAWI